MLTPAELTEIRDVMRECLEDHVTPSWHPLRERIDAAIVVVEREIEAGKESPHPYSRENIDRIMNESTTGNA